MYILGKDMIIGEYEGWTAMFVEHFKMKWERKNRFHCLFGINLRNMEVSKILLWILNINSRVQVYNFSIERPRCDMNSGKKKVERTLNNKIWLPLVLIISIEEI